MAAARKILGALALWSLVSMLAVTGGLTQIEYLFQDLRFRLFDRQASEDIVMVQIDPASLAEFDSWPWPRDLHARLVDRLFKLDAEIVVFDVDFSARSTPQADQAFAEALKRQAGKVYLPVFRQVEEGDSGTVLFESTPLAAFREHVWLASANVVPAADGRIRDMSVGERISGQIRPTLAALLAEASSQNRTRFLIDFSIDPRTIPRISYADVVQGRVGREQIADKKILVGSSAIELGDYFAVPRWNTLPGVVIQGLAAESLIQGRAITVEPTSLALLFALVVAVLFTLLRPSGRLPIAITANVATIFLLIAVPIALESLWACTIEVAPAIVVMVLIGVSQTVVELHRRARAISVQRAAIEYRRALMQTVVDSSFDGVLITSREGVIEACNASAVSLLDTATDSLVGRNVIDIFGAAASAELQDAQPMSARAPSRRFVVALDIRTEQRFFELATKDLSFRPPAKGRPGATADREVRVFTFRDVTEQRTAEQAQRAALEEMATANKAKTEFLANMSHELRTPLNAVIGFSDIMQTETFGPLGDPAYGEYAKLINDSGQHLLALVNDILDVSRVEAGRLDLHSDEIALAKFVASCAGIIRGWDKARERRIEWDLPEEPVRLNVDSRLLRQSLINVIANAVKFTDAGGKIAICFRETEEGGCRFTVTDDGIGIPAEKLDGLGEPFKQVDATLSRNFDGCGLGLYLTRRFVELHGGALEIESEESAGTAVTLHLPPETIVPREDEIKLAS